MNNDNEILNWGYRFYLSMSGDPLKTLMFFSNGGISSPILVFLWITRPHKNPERLDAFRVLASPASTSASAPFLNPFKSLTKFDFADDDEEEEHVDSFPSDESSNFAS